MQDFDGCPQYNSDATFAYLFPMNTLYNGDILNILRDYIKDQSVPPIYTTDGSLQK